MASCSSVLLLAVAVAVALLTAADARGLYGMINPPQLVSVDVTSGKCTNVGPPIPAEGQAQELSTMDDKNGLFYIVGYNFTVSQPNLVAISLSTGRIVSNVLLPFAESVFVGVGQALDYDAGSSDYPIIASGRLDAAGPHAVLRMNPKTAAFKQIATIDAGDVLGGASIYNPANNVEYLEYAYNDTYFSRVVRRPAPTMPRPPTSTPNRLSIDLFGVDMGTGKIDHIIEDSSTGHVLTTLQFDPKSKSLVGLGYKVTNGTFQRIFARFDAGAKIWYQVSEIKEFLIESGGVSALDTTNRILYVIMQKTNVPQSDPFYLVGINIDTGVVVTRSILCQDFPLCPWSLEFNN